MSTLAVICGLVSGLALMAIQLRHMGWKASFLDRDVREALGKPLDQQDKRLLMVSGGSFLLCILFLVLSY